MENQKVIANDYRTGALLEIELENDRFKSLDRLAETANPEYPWICPGFIDLQVNGFGGFDLNSPSVNPLTVSNMVQALADHGVTSCMPTIVTASRERIALSIAAIREACEQDPMVSKSIVGIHLEGPYLSAEPGFRGAHPAEEMRLPDWREFTEWQRLSGNRIGKVTLAPELPGAVDFIGRLKRQGVIASMGHSNASSEEIRQAMEAGLSMCTHLGNGVHYILNRHAPCLWDLLASGLYAGFIADGHHLPQSVVQVIVKMKGRRAILVSDAVHLAGMKSGRYQTHIGGEVDLLENGRLQLAADPNVLAGSAMSMLNGVHYLLRLYPGKLKKVLDMATANPASLLHTKRIGRLAAGASADFILFHFDRTANCLRLGEIWLKGSRIRNWKDGWDENQ